MKTPKPTHVFVGRDEGGCCVHIFNPETEKKNNKLIKEAQSNGLTVTIAHWETYTNTIANEATFMKCNCPELGELAYRRANGAPLVATESGGGGCE